MTKKPTIKDVAKLAESSITTVSRVLNKSDYPVSKELADRIIEAAEELNYKPNIFGQMLKSGVSKEVGIVVPNISNPYYSQLVSAIEFELVNAGYTTNICSSFDDVEMEENHIDRLIQRQVTGVIISSVGDAKKNAEKLEKENLHFVLFDQDYSQLDFDSVSFDFYKSSCMAVEFLIANELKEIAFLTTSLERASRKQIYQGYLHVLRKHGIEPREDLLIQSLSTKGEVDEYETGNLLAEKLLENVELPDAIVAINDVTAFGIINTLETNGIKIPEDISVISFDDISFAKMFTPALTTMRQPSRETGKNAAQMLMAKIEDANLERQIIMIEPELIIRDTVKIKK